MSNPAGLSPDALLLGRLDQPGRDGRAGALPAAADAVLVPPGQPPHLLTIAPNRSGRDRSCLIPSLLTYAGPAVVIDLDGRAHAATAAARRAMGQSVVRLDPFGVTGPETDTLDPLDLLDGRDPAAIESGCQDIAAMLAPASPPGDVGEHEAIGLLSAVIGYLWAVPERQMDYLYAALHADDVVYSLAVVLDTIGKKIPKMSYTEIASFLQHEDRVRSRILARATSIIKGLGSSEVQKSLKGSSFAIRAGAPVTVYIVLPADRVAIHATLLRLWIGTILLQLTRPPDDAAQPPLLPARPALLLLDHCAELGTFPLLESLLAIPSAGDFRIWTFWHDVHQLRATYPRGWPAIVAGCGAVQVFGSPDPAAAAEAAAVLGLPASEAWSLGPGEQILRTDGAPFRARRIDAREPAAAATGH